MKLFRDPMLKKALLIQLTAMAVGFIVCLFFSAAAAFILLGTSAVFLTVQSFVFAKRQQKLSQLCDEIDRILHGAEQVNFDSYQEGELSLLAAEIQKMTVRLREQNSILRQDRQFMKEALEDMSHQLRTPLTTMNIVLQMLKGSDISVKQRTEYVVEMRELLSKMKWITETMLNLSRLEAQAVTFRTERLYAADIVAEASQAFSVSMELKGIEFVTDIQGEPSFFGDRNYFCEALENIFKNCIEHTPQGGKITVRCEENSIFTGIKITDSGKGISEQDLPHIFDRFYRSSDFAKSGYGIGLAFARKIVTSQNGSLQVKNALPHGAEFEMKIYKKQQK